MSTDLPRDDSTFIDSNDALLAVADDWRDVDIVGIDTEFVRTRTFFAKLGLIQLRHGEQSILIDPVALTDLEPLRHLLHDSGALVVFHAAAEDLEVLHHRFGIFPTRLADTQIAAAFAGFGFQVGYQRLVQELFGVTLPKGQTRTDWMQRPLSHAQLRYAALDVKFLIDLWGALRERLESRGYVSWALEEAAKLSDVDRFLPRLEDAYLRIKGRGKLNRRQLGALQIFAAWRENEARERDVPRSFVVDDPTLLTLARFAPTDRKALYRIETLKPGDRKRYGEALLERSAHARRLSVDELPNKPAQPPAPDRDLVRALRALVDEKARDLDLPPELLATRRAITAVAQRVIAGNDDPCPSELDGWRREIIAQPLADRARDILGAS